MGQPMAHKTAVFIDGGFFLKRLRSQFPHIDASNAKEVAGLIHTHALRHKTQIVGPSCEETYELYRIFYYDCPPLTKKMHYPVSKKSIDFSKTPIAIFRSDLRSELLRKRKVAVRMGHLLDAAAWRLKSDVLRDLLAERRQFDQLTDDDFEVDTIQKGVDMRLGLDVASLAYKKLVDQIILVVGDSDFVPAAKLARREGIDVILDPLGQVVHESLNEHIDGMRTPTWPSKSQRTPPKITASFAAAQVTTVLATTKREND
jgi:uncharacterized LabA/DUF88 family protein